MKRPVGWALGAIEYTIAAGLMLLGIAPAWAASVTIPIGGNTYEINLGDLPSWIIAGVAVGGYWQAYKAKKTSLANSDALVVVKSDVKLLERNTNSLTKQLEANARREGKEQGLEAGKQQGVERADERAKGVADGIAQERAAAAAAAAPPPPAPPTPAMTSGDKPVAVADDRTGAAVERIADATTIASERSADAVERLADVVRSKTPT